MIVNTLVAGHFYHQLLNAALGHSCCHALPTIAPLDNDWLLHPNLVYIAITLSALSPSACLPPLSPSPLPCRPLPLHRLPPSSLSPLPLPPSPLPSMTPAILVTIAIAHGVAFAVSRDSPAERGGGTHRRAHQITFIVGRRCVHGEPTHSDEMVSKAGTRTSYHSRGGALIASRHPPLQRLAMVGCCILCVGRIGRYELTCMNSHVLFTCMNLYL